MVSQRLLQLLSSMALELVEAPFPANAPFLKRVKEHGSPFCEEVICLREHLFAPESKIATILSAVRAEAAELKTSLKSSTSRVHCLEREPSQREAVQVEEGRDAARRTADDQPVQMDASQRKMAVLKQFSENSWAEVCCLSDVHACDRNHALPGQTNCE